MQKLKLSPETIGVLKNFSSINKEMLFKPGNTVSVIHDTKSIIGVATIAESFESEFAIGDMPRFLSVLSLFDEPELNIGDKFLTIKEGKRKLNYTFTAKNSVLFVEDESLVKLAAVMQKKTATFQITNELYQQVSKGMLVLKLPNIAFVGDGSELTLHTTDYSNPTSDTYSGVIGESDQTFKAIFKAENMKQLPLDYQVDIVPGVLAHFTSIGDQKIEYYVAMEAIK